jgi:large subunit ribosomal protein L15
MKHSLPKSVTTRPSKRLGRGVGSGKGGHTAGRGTKGQGARNKIGILFEGVKTKKSLLHRLPMLPGKFKNKPMPKPVSVRLSVLEDFKSSEVTEQTLLEAGIVRSDALKRGVKLVGSADLKKAFAVKVAATLTAQEAIKKASGTLS